MSETIVHHRQNHPMPCVTVGPDQLLNGYSSVWTMIPDTFFCFPKAIPHLKYFLRVFRHTRRVDNLLLDGLITVHVRRMYHGY